MQNAIPQFTHMVMVLLQFIALNGEQVNWKLN